MGAITVCLSGSSPRTGSRRLPIRLNEKDNLLLLVEMWEGVTRSGEGGQARRGSGRTYAEVEGTERVR